MQTLNLLVTYRVFVNQTNMVYFIILKSCSTVQFFPHIANGNQVSKVKLLADLISHISIPLLIITIDFVALS